MNDNQTALEMQMPVRYPQGNASEMRSEVRGSDPVHGRKKVL
jgi:hypothetical protein